MRGIEKLYGFFLRNLREQKHKIAVLQLTGRIEDFLVKEFVYFAYEKSGRKIFALTNIGKRGQKKIDICLLRGKNLREVEVYGMIEAKYFRNRHRFKSSNAMDETSPTLNSLKKQLYPFKGNSQGGFKVNLLSLTDNIYGLILASYVNEKKDNKVKKNFYQAILSKAEERNFRSHDLQKPYFNPVFEDVKSKVLNTNFYVTLRAGLWKKK